MIKYTREYVEAALQLADREESKINEREKELFGLSSTRLRSFLNNICTKPNTKYLEIGVYRGATLISAMYGNPTCKAVGIESFQYEERELTRWAPKGQIWPNMKSQLLANIERYKDPSYNVQTGNIAIIDQPFEEADLSTIGKFNVCFFDVSPITAKTYTDFADKILPLMEDESVVIFSNYSNESSSALLNEFKNNIKTAAISFELQRISSGLSDSTKYYSGILVLGLKKVATKTIGK